MSWVDNFFAAAGLECCHHCGGAASRGGLCANCLSLLIANTNHCSRCALPLVRTANCLDCQRRAPPWQSCAAPWEFQDPVRGWLHQAKFHENLIALRVLCQLARATRLPRTDLVCPVPMPTARLARRGVNVAAELAAALARKTSRPCALALHTQCTRQQLQQGRPQRLRRGEVPFQAARKLAGQSVLLVDDVMTTGATLRAGTDSLLRAGAAEVHVFALLRTPLRPSRSPRPDQ